MPDQNEPVKPTPFTVADAPVPPTATPATTPGRPSWAVPAALLALLLVALGVIFWLPQQFAPPAPGDAANGSPPLQPPAAASPPARPTSATEAEPAASPWSDAQQARLRKEAQDVLAQLLELQFQLEEQGADQWAQEAFATAAGTAARGDEHYQARRFVEAKETYQQSLGELQALQDSIPAILEDSLARARDALERGERAEAEEALASAAQIEPDNEELAALQARVETLEPLLDLLASAAEAEAGGDLAAAEQLLDEAAKLDPAHRRAAAELERVRQAHREQRYNQAMSEGYAALDSASFGAARKAFRQAGKLRPDAAEVSSALAELQVAETAARLARLQTEAARLEDSESWAEAQQRYREALELDPSLVFAQEGLVRTEPRARLDKQLREALAKPERLTDADVAASLRKTLQQAAGVKPQGTRLQQQVSELEQLLAQASTPVTVTLTSDTQTNVVVLKVARLGQFATRELELRPGSYTAVGSRDGYRDVRHTFTVGHDQDSPNLFIACTEPI